MSGRAHASNLDEIAGRVQGTAARRIPQGSREIVSRRSRRNEPPELIAIVRVQKSLKTKQSGRSRERSFTLGARSRAGVTFLANKRVANRFARVARKCSRADLPITLVPRNAKSRYIREPFCAIFAHERMRACSRASKSRGLVRAFRPVSRAKQSDRKMAEQANSERDRRSARESLARREIGGKRRDFAPRVPVPPVSRRAQGEKSLLRPTEKVTVSAARRANRKIAAHR